MPQPPSSIDTGAKPGGEAKLFESTAERGLPTKGAAVYDRPANTSRPVWQYALLALVLLLVLWLVYRQFTT